MTSFSGGQPARSTNVADEILGSPAYEYSAAERQAELVDAIRRAQVEVETLQRDQALLIEEAQRQGVSWSRIGEAQGVTPQAAQQRFKRWKKSRGDEQTLDNQRSSQ